MLARIAADPWGAALAVTGGLSLFGLAWVVLRQGAAARTGAAGWVFALGLAGFLSTAAGGTLARIRLEKRAPAREDPPPAPPLQGEDGSRGSDGDEPPAPEPVAAVGSALRPVEPLPTDPRARSQAIRRVMRAAKAVYEDPRACKRAAAVGQAWAELLALPASAPRARVEVIVRRLDGCRRNVRWAMAYSVHRQRVDARDRFAPALTQRLRDDHGLSASVRLTGKNHEHMRIGSGKFDASLAALVMTETFRAELTELGIERVVLASPNKTWTTTLGPKPESDYVTQRLVPYGLQDPLELPAG